MSCCGMATMYSLELLDQSVELFGMTQNRRSQLEMTTAIAKGFLLQ